MHRPRASHAAPPGALVAASLAGLFALGPFAAAVVNSVIVEVAIARAAHLPAPQLLPAALDGMGGLALVALAVLRGEGVPRAWLWTLVLVSLAASMAANGAHAAFPLDRDGLPELPWQGALFVAFVAPLSAAASADLVLRIGRRVVELAARVASARVSAAPPAGPPAPPPPRPRTAPDAQNPRVLELVRGGAGYRVVAEELHWTRPRAEEAVRAARAHLGLPERGRRAEAAA